MYDHTVLQYLPVAAYTTDSEGRLTYFNEAAARLWGQRPQLGTAKWCGSWRLYWTDGRPMSHDECPMAIALKEGREVLGMEAVAERPDGSRVLFAPYLVPIKDREGHVTGGINLLIDISNHKEAEIAAARLAAIVSSSDDAIVSKNLDSVITSWNEGAKRLFGYEAEEVVGKSIRLLIPADLQQQEDEILAKIGRGERIEHFDTVRVTKDGTYIDVSLTISPILDANGKIIGASKIARDVRERKRNEELQRLLFNELNHRVKNTLATIQAIASQSMRTSSSPGDFVDSFNGRVAALSRAHNLLVEQKLRGTNLARLVEEQVNLGKNEADRVVCAGPDVAISSRIAVHMALVLHELATNARKYGALSVPTGKLSVSWEIVERSGRELHLTWLETGVIGLRPPQSRGFGTTLIERSLEANQGETSLEFGEDGLVCEISLPLPEEDFENTLDANDTAPDDTWLNWNGNGTDKGKRLLVVEDEPLVAMEIEYILESHGFEVVGPALQIESARQMIDEGHFDAALLDANLAGHSSAELAAMLVAKSVPFAFATGYGRDGLPSGFDDIEIISKPFAPDRLVSVVQQLVNGSDA